MYFLFMGACGSGKTLVVRALSHECNAIVFDISPYNIINRFTDKASTNKLLYMTFFCAKEFQPAIIYIDEVESIFAGGKKKKSTGPARYKKPLLDFKKALKKAKHFDDQDRVVVIGCTNKANKNDFNLKEAKTYFEKKIFFPFPNYATRIEIFKAMIEEKGVQLQENFPISMLAHYTEGYTGGNF